MLPAICPLCSPHLAHMRELAASGLKNILAFAEEMKAETDTLPDELKPIGEALAEMSIEALTKHYFETLLLISEMGMQKITQAELPPKDNTESDSLKRSRTHVTP
jgi:hypothetical protein